MTVSRRANPAEWDIEMLIEALGNLDNRARAGALSVFAHHLTVETRLLLSEGAVDQPIIDRVRTINEFEHHLTSRLHPDGLRAAEGDTSLLRDIADDAARCGLSAAVKRGLVIAVQNALLAAKKPVAAH